MIEDSPSLVSETLPVVMEGVVMTPSELGSGSVTSSLVKNFWSVFTIYKNTSEVHGRKVETATRLHGLYSLPLL